MADTPDVEIKNWRFKRILFGFKKYHVNNDFMGENTFFVGRQSASIKRQYCRKKCSKTPLAQSFHFKREFFLRPLFSLLLAESWVPDFLV
jgi:hypothetical protein